MGRLGARFFLIGRSVSVFSESAPLRRMEVVFAEEMGPVEIQPDVVSVLDRPHLQRTTKE